MEKKKYFSNIWSFKLLSIARQINAGWDFLWHVNATFNFCRAEARLITLGPSLGHNSLGVHYHNLCWTIMGGSRETKQTYEQSYDAVQRAEHLIFKLPVCCLKDCITCAAVRLFQSHAKMSAFLSRDYVVPNKALPADGVNLDCGGAVVSFARETLGVDPSKCGAHITGIARKQQQRRTTSSTLAYLSMWRRMLWTASVGHWMHRNRSSSRPYQSRCPHELRWALPQSTSRRDFLVECPILAHIFRSPIRKASLATCLYL